MANFGTKNETFAYLVGKDIAEIKAKIENIGTTGGGLDVLKVIVPAATEEQVNSNALCVASLPKEFQNSLALTFQNGSWIYVTTENEIGVGLSTEEQEIFIIKLTDFTNPKETVHAEIRETRRGGAAASDA